MIKDLLKIINHYGVMNQLKHFQSEVFELTEAIIRDEEQENGATFYKEHITEEIADVLVMLNQFICYYDLNDEEINEIMFKKIDRQLERIANENSNN